MGEKGDKEPAGRFAGSMRAASASCRPAPCSAIPSFLPQQHQATHESSHLLPQELVMRVQLVPARLSRSPCGREGGQQGGKGGWVLGQQAGRGTPPRQS